MLAEVVIERKQPPNPHDRIPFADAEFIGDPPINLLPCQVRSSPREAFVATALHEVIVLPLRQAPMGAHWLGIRPHELRLTREKIAGAARTTVRFVENLGAEHVAYVDYGDAVAAAIMRPGLAAPGDAVWASVNAAKVHLIRSDNDQVVLPEAA